MVLPLTLVTCTICVIRYPVLSVSPHQVQLPYPPFHVTTGSVSPCFSPTIIQSFAETPGDELATIDFDPFVYPLEREAVPPLLALPAVATPPPAPSFSVVQGDPEPLSPLKLADIHDPCEPFAEPAPRRTLLEG